ncbi:hypothetical protein [Sphingobacterium siyangense]|uniref:hypothetical protein n=1 Tax=Sphingobacterium siyangense TaxID=459529 RepID=UPI0019635E60|nr:hypothetical protein [Sphingobacterium siyangense]QRY60523.1 hypothetical protein JVX97_14170 [Sphingobacterium siyangense]
MINKYKITEIDVFQHPKEVTVPKSITLTVELSNNKDEDGNSLKFDERDFIGCVAKCYPETTKPRFQLIIHKTARRNKIIAFFRADDANCICIDLEAVVGSYLIGDPEPFEVELEVYIKFRYVNRNERGLIINRSEEIKDLKLLCLFVIEEEEVNNQVL